MFLLISMYEIDAVTELLLTLQCIIFVLLFVMRLFSIFSWFFNLDCSAFNLYLDEDDDEDDGNDSMIEANDAERMIESNEDYHVVGKISFYIFEKFLRASWWNLY